MNLVTNLFLTKQGSSKTRHESIRLINGDDDRTNCRRVSSLAMRGSAPKILNFIHNHFSASPLRIMHVLLNFSKESNTDRASDVSYVRKDEDVAAAIQITTAKQNFVKKSSRPSSHTLNAVLRQPPLSASFLQTRTCTKHLALLTYYYIHTPSSIDCWWSSYSIHDAKTWQLRQATAAAVSVLHASVYFQYF